MDRGPNTRFYTDNFIFGFFGVKRAYPEKPKDKIAGKADRYIKNMKIFFSILLTLTIFDSAYAETKWESYLAYPNSKNASDVQNLEYTPGTIGANNGYWEPDLLILQNQVLGGDGESFKLAYRLMIKADGALREELTTILGRSIRAQPYLFLKEISIIYPTDRTLRSILLMTGEEYVDRPDAKRYEIEKRREAIQSVKDSDTEDLKLKCVNILVK